MVNDVNLDLMPEKAGPAPSAGVSTQGPGVGWLMASRLTPMLSAYLSSLPQAPAAPTAPVAQLAISLER